MIIHQEKRNEKQRNNNKNNNTQKIYIRYDLCAWNFSVSVHENLNKQHPKNKYIYFF